MPYTTIITEGGLLPADLLDELPNLEGQRPEDFGLERSRNLTDRIGAAWQAARGHWLLFQSYLEDLGEHESATSATREQWVLPLLRTLGYRVSFNQRAYILDGRTYAISHRAGEEDDAPPIHIESIRASLDARPPSGRPRLSPHALVQEYLNGTDQLWGIVTNGERLRLLRDSARFTRPAYVEFDLRAMLAGEQFSEFALLYRLLHRSRLPLPASEPSGCLLERYHQRAVASGGRVRDGLRDGVEQALRLLGNGLLAHPANAPLRAEIAAGQLVPLEFYRQLLRLVYRLLFLMVAEERNLVAAEPDEADLLAPETYRPSADARLAIYADYYSVSRLRRLAEQPAALRSRHADAWIGLLMTFRLFEGSDEDLPRRFGLAALDGDLFGEGACRNLTADTRIENVALLGAIRQLSIYQEKSSKTLRRVNYGALDVEELGSVYESLLDFRPVIQQPAGATFPRFELVTGTERKTTGSYYTRPELVQELVKSALEPVIAERLRAAANPPAREAAILAIRVVDPAAGSGHFLLAAARRLGRELARVRSGEDQPTPTVFRAAVRDVVQHCIFGVDLNPLAVDLCKLALWIEGHCAAMPLSFLDHHIKHGNSLVGATRALVAQGIPDDAYKAIGGDEKATVGSIKKRNKAERERYLLGMQQQHLFAPASDGVAELADAFEAIDALPNASVAGYRARAAAYRAASQRADAERARFDLWTAAFFQPLTPANAALVPTTADLAAGELTVANRKVALATALAGEVGFFHWELEFPQVFHEHSVQQSRAKAGQPATQPHDAAGLGASVANTSGFDVVLGNPPWERIKLQEQEHFVDVPEIAGAGNKSQRERAIERWRGGDPRQRARIAEFDVAKQRAEAESRFVRASERYPLTAVGDVNTYALFAEHSRSLLSATGRAGIIVPTGIATDDSTKAFFGDLTAHGQLVSLYDFENSEAIFPGVHRSYKFSLITLGSTSQPAQLLFFASRTDHLRDELRRFTLTADEIGLLNPNTRTAPVFRTSIDAELTKKIYRSTPVLVNERLQANTIAQPNRANHRGTKDTKAGQSDGADLRGLRAFVVDPGANPQGLAATEAGQPDGADLRALRAFVVPSDRMRDANPWGVRFMTMFHMSNDSGLFHDAPGDGRLPLYEAKLLHQFTHRWATYQDDGARDMTAAELADPNTTVTPRYYVERAEVDARLGERGWTRGWLLGFRDIARSTDERTAIFSLIPRVGVGNNAPLIFLPDSTVSDVACFIACVSSLTFDFVTRPKVGGIHLNFFIVEQLPVLPPERFSAEDIGYIVPRVLELVYTAWDMQPFAQDVWQEADQATRDALLRRNAACNVGADQALFAPRGGFALAPYRWDEIRRAQIRAELDARIARLYGLSRDELRYILDPQDIHGPEFPGETFRVLKEKEIKLYGEYRTRRLVLAAWDAATAQ